ncbi:Cytochrome P450 71A2 [Camellia lanceoleosa]|nr:Cytochrome P450 71A2 [Camellia lanceoleosa]
MFSLLHPFFLSFLPLFFFTLLLLKWLSTTQKPHKNLPPSPLKLPIIGNLHQMGQFPHRSLLSLSQKHGPLMLLQFGSMPVLVISSAQAAQEIMKTHDLTFSDRPKLSIASKLLYEARDVGFALWRVLEADEELMCAAAPKQQAGKVFLCCERRRKALMIEKIKQSCSSSSSTMVNLSEMLVSLTNGVVCRVALGRKHSGRKFKELLGEFVELLGVFDLGDYIPWLAWVNSFNGLYKRVDRVAKELDDFLESVVEEHMDLRREKSGGERADHEGGDEIQQDFVNVLLDIQRDNKVGFPVDRDSIKALILEFKFLNCNACKATQWTNDVDDYDGLDKSPSKKKIGRRNFIPGDVDDYDASNTPFHCYLKFVLLFGLFILGGSQQAVAGSDFASGLQSISFFGDLGDVSTCFASVRKISLVALGRKHNRRKFTEPLGEFVELLGVFDLGDCIPWLAWVNSFNGWIRVDRVAKELDDLLEIVVEEHMDLRTEKSGGERANHEGGVEIQQDFVDVLFDIQKR